MEFSSEAEAAEAIRRFDGQEVDGRKLRVNTAEDRPRRSDGPRFAPANSERLQYRPAFTAPVPDPWSVFSTAAFGAGAAGGKPFKTKGSRRGLRARKRSLSY